MVTGGGTMTLAIAGDTMLGRGVGERIARGRRPERFVADEIVAAMAAADVRLLNLECCISTRGDPWPAAGKPFFFRAPPAATDLLRHLGVDLVTLANNHALDYGADALLDTLEHLDRAGIAWVGAGESEAAARMPVTIRRGGFTLAVVGVADHPADFAAGPGRPGIAWADLEAATPGWLTSLVTRVSSTADAVVVTPHWGPNMITAPLPHLRRAGADLVRAGATLVAGHSAHVFQGVAGRILHDLGDFLDDYAVDPELRNDLGLLWIVTLGSDGPTRIEVLPLRLGFCATRLADGDDAAWIADRLTAACGALGSRVVRDGSRLVVLPDQGAGAPPPSR
jgi:poly-gamma-glutamate synthesis protein (capsule biosynthesis protein)